MEKDVLCNARAAAAAAEDRIETVMARQTGFEQEMTESHGSLEEASNCVRYGLVEIGGFVRNAKLTVAITSILGCDRRGS